VGNKISDEPNDEILTIKELAAYLKMAGNTIYRFVSKGKTSKFKVGSISSRSDQIGASLNLK